MRAIYQLIGNNVKTCFKINSMYESKFGGQASHGFSSFVTLYKYLMSKKVYHHSFVASNIVAMVTYIVKMTNVICLSIVINGNNLGFFRGVKCIMNSINTTPHHHDLY